MITALYTKQVIKYFKNKKNLNKKVQGVIEDIREHCCFLLRSIVRFVDGIFEAKIL